MTMTIEQLASYRALVREAPDQHSGACHIYDRDGQCNCQALHGVRMVAAITDLVDEVMILQQQIAELKP